MPLDRYYTLGRSGLRVSRLALGTMTFGTDWGWGADRAACRALFDAYVGAGGNFFDTADLYTNGVSEEWLGGFIRETGSRDRSVIATKYTHNPQPGNPNSGGNHRKNLMRAVEGSLQRLGTDYIDLYFLHNWDQVTPVEEVMRGLDDLVRAGKIRYVGLSNVPGWYAGRAQTLAEWRGWEPVSSLQMEYSLAERGIEREFTALSGQLGMGIMVWSPLCSGLLSGKYRPDGSGAGRLAALKDSGGPLAGKFTERNWKIVAALDEAARATGRSHAQVAINWVANQPGVGSVILGATQLAQLEDTLQSLAFDLPPEWRGRLDAASAPESIYPYSFFGSPLQNMIAGGSRVGDKPDGYFQPVRIGDF